MRNLRFAHRQEGHSRRLIHEKLCTYAFPLSNDKQFFAYDCKEQYRENGWDVYDATRELRRQGVPNDTWRVTTINDNYELCDTYPKVLAVPKATRRAATRKATLQQRDREDVVGVCGGSCCCEEEKNEDMVDNDE